MQNSARALQQEEGITLHTRRSRVLMALFYGVGFLIVALVANLLSSTPPQNRIVVTSGALLGIIVSSILLVPKVRPTRIFVTLHSLIMVGIIALIISGSDGATSPWTSLYFLVIVFAVLTSNRGTALLIATAVGAAQCLPLLRGMATPNAGLQLALQIPLQYCIAFFGASLTNEMQQFRRSPAPVPGLEPQVADHLPALELQIDPLTQLLSRTEFERRLTQLLTERLTAICSLILIHIDQLDAIKEQYGSGRDDVLRQIGLLLQNQSRYTDITARYGDREFAVLLPDAPRATAQLLGERLRLAVERHRFWTPHSATRLSVTISIGTAAYPDDARTPVDLCLQAEAGMKTTGHTGRSSRGPGPADEQDAYQAPDETTISK